MKRSWSRVAAIVLALVVSVGSLSVPAYAQPESAAIRTAAQLQPQWNLGNSLDAIPDETSWGNPPATQALFDSLRGQGFRSVRIPVTWGNHQSATAPYVIEPAFVNRVKQVVDWALSDGLYVVLNVHHDSWQWIAAMPGDHDNVRARFDATWQQIAAAFRNESPRLLFESVNEPQFTNATDLQKMQLLNELNVSFHTIVRRSGGNNATRMLVLPTVSCTPSQIYLDSLVATMESLNDRNLVATVHYYSFWPFSVNIAGYTHFDATVQKDLTDTFARLRDTLAAKGIPVLLGEYGLLANGSDWSGIVERGEALKYFEMLGHQARISGVVTAFWDNGSFVDRTTYRWRDQDLFNRLRSSWTTRSGTASTDQVFVPKSAPVTDQTLTLNRNGTAFAGLWHGRTPLVPGRDYTVAADRLTLEGPLLRRLTRDGAYGVSATLQARFSRGVPWSVNVITYDPPALSDTTGTTGSFAIPARFRGDVLATMESSYADGSNAGPVDWTPYQEFGTSFSPDYDASTIILTPVFLNALNDGMPATLTFHFWSGATATYRVTKSPGSVVGTATEGSFSMSWGTAA